VKADSKTTETKKQVPTKADNKHKVADTTGSAEVKATLTKVVKKKVAKPDEAK